ncbi:hypothetical protein JCM19314_608 [Nonlabens ulvanivorans]|uniref:DUF4349 domain-containing protein n=1 Tax=Nonlabens ulvanivorans TaxID=906888 RepID=A0A090QH91_NONUL|nr:hypothetical protein [Nonlabens ulvanivorans]GAL01164.1 hypothetical protein JCM19314_608 [Nonlabens ulvanivorans]
MKNILLVSILCLMCLSLNAQFSYDKGSAISQRQDNPNGSPEDNKQKIKTSVITIDLSSPTPDAIIHSGNFNRLMTIEKAPLSFRLINGNSLKYDYELLYKKVDLYGVSSFDIKPKNSANDSPTPLIDAPESVFVINEVVDETMIDGKKETIIKSILDIEEAKTRLDDFLTNVKTLSVDLEIYLADLRSSNNLNFENLEAIREEFNRYYSEISGYHINIKNEYRELSEDSQLLFATEMNQLDTEIEKIRQNIVTLYQVNEVVYTLPIDVDGDNIDYIEIELRRSFKDQLNATP